MTPVLVYKLERLIKVYYEIEVESLNKLNFKVENLLVRCQFQYHSQSSNINQEENELILNQEACVRDRKFYRNNSYISFLI